MKIKPLIETNPYLSDASLYESLLTVNVTSSTAIELGTIKPSILKALKEKIEPRSTSAVNRK